MTEWALEDLDRFARKLRPSDEVAVEITSNTRLFYDAVAGQVARVHRAQIIPLLHISGRTAWRSTIKQCEDWPPTFAEALTGYHLDAITRVRSPT